MANDNVNSNNLEGMATPESREANQATNALRDSSDLLKGNDDVVARAREFNDAVTLATNKDAMLAHLDTPAGKEFLDKRFSPQGQEEFKRYIAENC